MGITITQSEGMSGAWAAVNAGVYEAEIANIEEAPASTVFPDSGPRLKIVFALPAELDDNGAPVQFFHFVTQKLTVSPKKSNLWKVCEALGMDPTGGVNTEQLIGLRARVVISIKGEGEQSRPVITDVWAPTEQPAPTGSGLRGKGAPQQQRTAAPAPQAVEQPDKLVCEVPRCGREAFSYDNNGAALCPQHGGNAA